MYKCIKLREIESALCCLPSVPGQCNELANISKGDLKKNYVGFRPILHLEQQTKNKNKMRSNAQQCHHIIFQIIRSKEK